MTNGSNDFGVTYSYIAFVESMLRNHSNVAHVSRSHDVRIEAIRIKGGPLVVVTLDEYACSLVRVLEVIDIFPEVNTISVGGNWNGYTGEAKTFCLERRIGIFNNNELVGATWKAKHWLYTPPADD